MVKHVCKKWNSNWIDRLLKYVYCVKKILKLILCYGISIVLKFANWHNHRPLDASRDFNNDALLWVQHKNDSTLNWIESESKANKYAVFS